MAHILDDNTVVPSWISMRPRGVIDDPGDLSNLAFRIGEVKEIVYPDNIFNQNRRFIEYSVEVQHRDGRGPATTSIYTGCMISNLFGGAADIFRYTLRKHNDRDKEPGEDGLGVGSKVLLLCVNGTNTRAVILGGVRDTQVDEDTIETSEDGHNLLWEFNGVRAQIDKRGQLKLQVKGPTRFDGSPDTEAGALTDLQPAALNFDSNGSIKASTRDDAQHIFLDNENKLLSLSADQELRIHVNGVVNESFGDTWLLDCGAKIGIKAQSDITLQSSAGSITLQSNAQSFIKSAGLQIGRATDAMPKFTTYRLAEASMHTQMLAQLGALAAQLGIAGGAITASITPMAIPVVGPVIAAPLLAPAGVALAAAATIVAQLVTNITTFESQALSFESTVNRND